MRLFWPFLPALVILMLAGPCLGVSDPGRTFSIEPPAGWTVWPDKADATADLRIMAPADNGYRANVGFQTLAESFALTAETRKTFRRDLQKELARRHITFTGEKDLKIDGAPAWKLTYRITMEHVQVAGYSIVVARAGKTWIITFLSSAAAFDRNSRLFDHALKTFKIL